MSTYHLNGIFRNSRTNSNGTVHPDGKFSENKVIPFEVVPFSRFYWNSQKFLYHLSTVMYSARLFTVILPRKNAKDLREAADFQNVHHTPNAHMADHSVVARDES